MVHALLAILAMGQGGVEKKSARAAEPPFTPGGPPVIVHINAPLDAAGKPVPTQISHFEWGADGQRVKISRPYSDQELLALGALPDSLRNWRAEQAVRKLQLRFTHNCWLLLESAEARKDVGFDADDVAAVALLKEPFDKLDREHLAGQLKQVGNSGKQEAWRRNWDLSETRQETLLKEAFGAKKRGGCNNCACNSGACPPSCSTSRPLISSASRLPTAWP